jgi:hypothetical protein
MTGLQRGWSNGLIVKEEHGVVKEKCRECDLKFKAGLFSIQNWTLSA